MDAEWIRSPMARRVLVHWADSRPAWLWSADGKSLLWRNRAARLFNAKLKKGGLRLAGEPVPIKGQVQRLLRLGSPGRSSLSRIQFLAGSKPLSATCTATPIELAGGTVGLLIVGVDAVPDELLSASDEEAFDSLAEALFPRGSEFLLARNNEILDGSPQGLQLAQSIEPGTPLSELGGVGAEEMTVAGTGLRVTRFTAGPNDSALFLLEPLDSTSRPAIADVRAEEGLTSLDPESGKQPMLPMGIPPVPSAHGEPAADRAEEEQWVEPVAPPAIGRGRSLSSLFDRLADRDELYAPLAEHSALEDDTDSPPAPPPVDTGAEANFDIKADPEDMIAAVISFSDDESDETPLPAAPVHYRVVGRGFIPADAASVPSDAADDTQAETPAGPAPQAQPDPALVERVSRYNFDELSRILTDRVGNEMPNDPAPEAAAPPTSIPGSAVAERRLVNVSAETFILNRLPLGIMVFRDQQVLFANRSMTELLGYDSVDALRSAGLAAVFPSEDSASAGPVTHLLGRSGSLLRVNARLQSISWQARPALMLSASLAEQGAEGTVRAFAADLARLRDEGFFTADRSGVITSASERFGDVLGPRGREAEGRLLASFVDTRSVAELRDFLERPARFAETARPSLIVQAATPGTELVVFAEGQAGITSGYFGTVRKLQPRTLGTSGEADLEPSMLVRISRGVRRPLNTIIGFADLIRSAAFGEVEIRRYQEYARDIKSAGHEIATLVDELDEFARLKEGRYAPAPADLDLATLLDSCMARVRAQAGAARVLVRSAISERLPRIRADQASMRQAVLNLLASAIDQTPPGGTVVLSAQLEGDGSIAVHVRDSGSSRIDPSERFVVFRDGVGKEGETLGPVRSSVGLALTRSLLAVNTCSLSVDPSTSVGTLFSLVIPADLVAGGD